MEQCIREWLYLLDRKAKKSIPFLILMFLFSSLLDVIGVGLVVVFLGLLTSHSFSHYHLPFFASFLNRFSEKGLIIFAGVVIVSAFAIKTVLTYLIQVKMSFFCQSLASRLQIRLMSAYQQASYRYHLGKNSADLISRMQFNIGGYISNVLLPILSFISNTLIAGSILLLLLYVHPIATLILLAMFFLLAFTYDWVSKKRLSGMGKIAALSGGEIIKNIHHGLRGLIEARVLGVENHFLGSLEKITKRYAEANSLIIAMQQIPRYLIENAIAIFIVGVSLVGIASGFGASTIVTTVGMFAAAGARLLPTVNQLVTSMSQIRGSYHHMKLIYDEFIELDELKAQHSLNILLPDKNKLPFSKIQLENISFTYPNSKYSALNNINITLTKGQSIGLIGPSGAGKSTLINIILGFLDPEAGKLRVDDQPILNLRMWWNNFAYIPQTIFLLDDTLKRNIAFGVKEEDIHEARLLSAVKMAQLNSVVDQLTLGVDTLIGENGVRLSGGQRQRVALARAFYHERDIIIMDEATSSLDNETEKEVIDTIKRFKGNKTLIVIAHRLSTVEHCDVLYRIEKGCTTAVGSFQEVVGHIT